MLRYCLAWQGMDECAAQFTENAPTYDDPLYLYGAWATRFMCQLFCPCVGALYGSYEQPAWCFCVMK
jgi:hypothetical protein